MNTPITMRKQTTTARIGRRDANRLTPSWRRRSRKNRTKYLYDGRRVIQERNSGNTPTVSYTRGTDLSGSLEGAGGIGGLLGRSHAYQTGSGNWTNHNFYHTDSNGNVTYLLNSSQTVVASYRYDPFGNTISSSGTLATANIYRFSSKEIHVNSGLYYYGYRFYDPNLQRWPNRDPIKERGGINLYSYSRNNPINKVDPYGLSCGPRGGIGDILVPDAPLGYDFGECCRAHDECYGGYGADRLACDNRWLECMQDACERAGGDGCCYAMANTYYAVVRAFGWVFFKPSPFDPELGNLPPGGIPGYELPRFAR